MAAFSGNSAQISQFSYYATVNDFSYELLEYDTYAQMLQAVHNGEADAIIQSDISLPEDFRIIGRFSPSDYYFALAPGNKQLLRQLNTAMQGLNSSQPNLQTELYNLYFKDSGMFQISDEHREYIRSLGTLKVLFFSGDAPYQYIKDGQLTGLTVEYLDQFAQITGLQYEPVVVNSYEEALPLVEAGEVDLVACVASNSTMASLDNVRFTVPYFNSFSVTACDDPAPHEHSNDLPFQINTQAALHDILSLEDYAVRADYYSLSYYLRKKVVYDAVVVDWANTKSFSYTIGVTDNISSQLSTLLNQYASSFTDESRQSMLYRYSGDDIQYSPGEWILVNSRAIAVNALIAGALIAIVLVYQRGRKMASKARMTEQYLNYIKLHDEMTGAYNEPYFRSLLAQAGARREGMALVAFNIRGFKYINDTYGTKEADRVLCEIKRILEEKLHEGEFFCRPSADLFYLALKEHSAEGVVSRANKLFSEITALLDGHPLILYSGAVLTADSPSPYSVSSNISYMMIALAHAKQVKCPTVYLFDEALYRTEQLRYYIETHMRSALAKEEYQLYLQPKINLHTGCVDGAEALVRWQPPDREMLLPGQFIPYFAETGFCVQLDLYMVEQACKCLRAWMDQGIPPITISVNQTKLLFLKTDYVEKLLSITGKYDIAPQYLILEVPEGYAFENITALNKTFQKLNQAGFRVSMDDFGSGYSSLNTLGKLKIDELKLDRMFLMDVVNDQNGSQSVVLSAVLSMARQLGIKTVAEGIENQASEELMRSMSCDYGQGYYYSKPIPAREFQEKFLKKAD